MISTDIAIWIGALWVIFAYSFIIRDNPLFKFCEATMIGTTAGVFTVIAFDNIKKLALLPLIEKQAYINMIPLIIGILLLAQVSRRHFYLSRLPIAIMVGGGIGATMSRTITSNIVIQLRSIMVPLPKTPFEILNIIILIVGLLGTLLIFTYTRERKGPFGWVTKIGEYLMMAALGSTFGLLITMRVTYVITRLQIIVFDLLGLG
jgi:hypothetical protein